MVQGIESFKEWFSGYEEHYAIIGGTACDLLMAEEGLEFRATKDIDLVLIVEAMDSLFGNRFWEYVIAAGYEHRNKSTGNPQFYRFSKPSSHDYPELIELFSRKPDTILLPENAVLSPLPMEDSISSLSAILLDADYYEFLKQGRIPVQDVTILDAVHLIPFKAKAWLDLSDRKKAGEPVDSRDIKKHKNDIFRLAQLLSHDQEKLSDLPDAINADMQHFIEKMASDTIDLKQLGIRGQTKESILDELLRIYCNNQ